MDCQSRRMLPLISFVPICQRAIYLRLMDATPSYSRVVSLDSTAVSIRLQHHVSMRTADSFYNLNNLIFKNQPIYVVDVVKHQASELIESYLTGYTKILQECLFASEILRSLLIVEPPLRGL